MVHGGELAAEQRQCIWESDRENFSGGTLEDAFPSLPTKFIIWIDIIEYHFSEIQQEGFPLSFFIVETLGGTVTFEGWLSLSLTILMLAR